MISFRVSEEEFDAFHDFCRTRGAGSVSDLARTAVFHMLELETTAGLGRNSNLEVRVRSIEREVKRLAGLVGRDAGRDGIGPVSIGPAARRAAAGQ